VAHKVSPRLNRNAWPRRLVAAMVSVFSVSSYAQDAQLGELVSTVDAIVAIEVAFVPYGDLVLVGEVLHGRMVELSSSNELLGACLPGKAIVRDLAQQAGSSVQGAVYQNAIERAGYKAVAFLKHEGGASRVVCDEGGFSTVNWETDPRFSAWRGRLQDEIAAQER
jgi:hypothetical protein